jgi:hypothetical protein
MSTDPILVHWTLHALDKAEQFGFVRRDVEAAVLGAHRERRRNPGAAAWKVVIGHMVIAYEYPDGEDSSTARVVTVWRR